MAKVTIGAGKSKGIVFTNLHSGEYARIVSAPTLFSSYIGEVGIYFRGKDNRGYLIILSNGNYFSSDGGSATNILVEKIEQTITIEPLLNKD